MDALVLVLWAVAGSSIPAIWEPNLRNWQWWRDIVVGSIISCGVTHGFCEYSRLNTFGERNAIALVTGLVAVALARNILAVVKSEGFKQWISDRLGIKPPDKGPYHKPDSDPML